MRLAGFFLALAVALPAWANFQSLQILGWSADEQRFALRLYDEEDSEGDDGKSFCLGYVDHKGQPFHGSLKLGVYEQGKKPTWFPIQDSGKCTPPEVLHWRLDYLLAEPELEGLVPPELLRQEVHRGTVAVRGSR